MRWHLRNVRGEIAGLRDRVEHLEDSVAAFVARAERDEKFLRPSIDVRRPPRRQGS